jgi:hypothetical protein
MTTSPLFGDAAPEPTQLTFAEMTPELIHKYAVQRCAFRAAETLHGVPGVVDRERLNRARKFHLSEGRAAGLRWITHYLVDSPDVEYTVLSFDMPIAWLVDRYWTVVPHFLSQVTKRHQVVVRKLVDLHVSA